MIGALRLLIRPVLRALRPVTSVVTALGWLALAVGFASVIVGAGFGWQEFLYLGFGLLAALLCAVGFTFGRATYDVRIELEPRRVVVGERALGRVLVTNLMPKRSRPSRLEVPVGSGLAEFVIPVLDPQTEHEEFFAVPTNHRAVIVAGPAETVRGDQLGLLRRTVRWAEPFELFVHPLTARLAPSAAGLMRDLEGEVTKTITNSDISFHALRAYEPGDDRRYVHWRTSARTGQLMVRQFEETRRSELTILLAQDARYFASDEEFELAVSILASLAVQLMRDGTNVNVLTEDLDLRTTSINTLLDDTCRIARGPARFPGVREFARVRTQRLPTPAVVVLISGSTMPIGEFRQLQRLFGIDTQTVGFRAATEGTAGLSALSGLRIATVSALDELPRLVRRAS